MSIGPQSTQDLQSVEIQDNDLTSSTLLENAPTKSLKSTYIVFICFVLMQIYSGLIAPSNISLRQNIYSTVDYNEISPIDFEVSFSSLSTRHSFIDVDLTLIRNEASIQEGMDITINHQIIFYKKQAMVKNASLNGQTKNVMFEANQESSEMVSILSTPIDDFDSALLKISIKANYKKINSIKFTTTYYNPNSQRFVDSLGFLNSILFVYMLIVFTMSSFKSESKFIRFMCIVLAILGISASNPISIFLNDSKFYLMLAPICIALAISFFRFSIFAIIERIRHNNSVNMIFIVLFIIAFGSNFFIMALALHERFNSNFSPTPFLEPFYSEKVNSLFDAVYVVLTVIYLIILLINNYSKRPRQVIFCLVMLIITDISTLFSNTYCLFNTDFIASNKRILTFEFVHLTCMAFTIYFHQPSENLSAEEYVQFQEDAIVNQDNDLNPEEISDK
ncbi:hypothetical protein GPJ56_010666 [Histomonas meleagridis]|uniref:uncharacterized protein n=1 Tax=Histomonas meleagridis TaxID=135588 RepID=UPI003559A87B|nr:hypothetical protein GPJ56_010666 [Histomonas meleagridis]KAH0806938.1 hypothetical protein GO595_000114 [Histomonas meleagridis]